MSEDQLAAFIARLKDDMELQEKLRGAADPDTFLAAAKEAGFELSKAQLIRYQAQVVSELTDEDLERVAGGNMLSIAGTLLLGCCGDVITAKQNIKVPIIC